MPAEKIMFKEAHFPVQYTGGKYAV